jgi:putative ABC transport system permease protein
MVCLPRIKNISRMTSGIIHIALRSIRYYRKPVFQQFAIVTLLAAVITGSVMTGYSVRESLKNSIGEKLGNTSYLVSSGLRYFKPALSEKLNKGTGTSSTSVLEANGFTQNFQTGKKNLKTKIYGIQNNFFSFQEVKTDSLRNGEVAINRNLASKLNIKAGDDIIITLSSPDDIPNGSPFAPSSESGASGVFTVKKILSTGEGGDFSMGISQVTPDNIFITIDNDLLKGKANRILVRKGTGLSEKSISDQLEKNIAPEDIGLTVRTVKATGECEIVSSRIFLDQNIINSVRSSFPDARPVITYLANSISYGRQSTPYSFIAAVDNDDISTGVEIVINDWLAKDIHARAGDTVTITWYSPLKTKGLEEKSGQFIISRIAGVKGIMADSMLMPDFPGIAGSKSCTEWDAGVKIKMEKIRKKDEDYWTQYRGTPKAFINYEKGKELWGNNFGPATAIRFPLKYNKENIEKILTGSINPSSAGFTVRNIYDEMLNGADNSIDFGTLFLSLGFFIIVSSIVLLVLAVSSFLDTRRKEIATYKSLGFKDSWIRKLLILETVIVAFTGSVAGGVAGIIINRVIVLSLNSVWTGAVNTSNIKAISGFLPLITGICLTFLATVICLYIIINRHLRKKVKEVTSNKPASFWISHKVWIYAVSAFIVLIVLFNFMFIAGSLMVSFISGTLLFAALIMLWRLIPASGQGFKGKVLSTGAIVSGRYYAFHPGKAMMPVLLIAAGLFAIIITGVNRQKITESSLSISGGTGGLRFWMETSVPLRDDINSLSGRKFIGIEKISPGDVTFIGGKKTEGDDASCLNLNYVASPPLLGINTSDFIKNRAFSFSSLADLVPEKDPWSVLDMMPSGNTIYGFADQTVLEWGLRKKTGDTLKFRSESGDNVNVIIAGGLKPSLFQGYLLVGEKNFDRFFPSVAGYSVFLVRGPSGVTDSLPFLLSDRLENYGITIQKAPERLASFFRVTNTYLSVFTSLGLFGMLLGVIGLGVVLNRNYTSRRKEFALMISCGFRIVDIRRIIFKEQAYILFAGIITGILSGLVATSSSVSSFREIPWDSIAIITLAIATTGVFSLLVSLKGIRQNSLIAELSRE